jgi:Family of unknown function (DUF695)
MLGLNKPFNKKGGTDPKEAFWKWFIENEKKFKAVIDDPDKAHLFLNNLVAQMKPYNPWLKTLAGPYGDGRFELIITADGDIALFCKVDELVKAAPLVEGWLITAHKPPIGSDSIQINMYGYVFGAENIKFYPVNDTNYPDEISIVLVHPDYKEDDHDHFETGSLIYLQNTLGELNTSTLIDSVEVKGISSAGENIDLIPISKLKDYLTWREKEFIEKYATMNAPRPAESYRVIEAAEDEGRPCIAVIDTGFKDWEYRSAYPWLVQIDIEYTGNDSGMPDENQMKDLQQIEDEILERLENHKPGFVIGHETHDGIRSIYLYTDKYYEVSKIVNAYLETTAWEYKMVLHIRKDKYWKNMELFFNAEEGEEGEED